MTAVVVAGARDLDDGEALVVPKETTGSVDDIAVFRDGGDYYALNDTCTHEKASLADGWIEDGVVECPMHTGKFCLRSGEVLSMPANEDTVAHRIELVGEDVVLYPGEAAVGAADRSATGGRA